MAALDLTVRFLHILFGVAWVGGLIFTMHAVVGPLRRLPPTVGGPAMGAIQNKAITLYAVAGPLTIVFGLWNQWLLAGELDFRSSTWNVLLGASLVLGLLMLLVGFGFQVPTFKRLQRLAAAGQGAGPDAARLRSRLMIGGITVTALGVVTLFLMVWATALTRGQLA